MRLCHQTHRRPLSRSPRLFHPLLLHLECCLFWLKPYPRSRCQGSLSPTPTLRGPSRGLPPLGTPGPHPRLSSVLLLRPRRAAPGPALPSPRALEPGPSLSLPRWLAGVARVTGPLLGPLCTHPPATAFTWVEGTSHLWTLGHVTCSTVNLAPGGPHGSPRPLSSLWQRSHEHALTGPAVQVDERLWGSGPGTGGPLVMLSSRAQAQMRSACHPADSLLPPSTESEQVAVM